MKIVVDKMPMYSAECLFSKEADNWRDTDMCIFTNKICVLCEDKCEFLIERINDGHNV